MNKYIKIYQTNKKLIVIPLFTILITFLIIIINATKKDLFFATTSDSDKFREEYESLNKEKTSDDKAYPEVNLPNSNQIKYSNLDEVLDILNNGTATIYIGYAKCLYCRSAIQVLLNTAKDMELEHIYYLDINNIWDTKELDENKNIITTTEAHEKYPKLLEELGDEYTENYILTTKDGETIDTQTKRVIAPLVIFVVDGDIVSSNVGTLFSQADPYTPLNEDQIKGLSEIYSYGIKDVLEGIKNNKARVK